MHCSTVYWCIFYCDNLKAPSNLQSVGDEWPLIFATTGSTRSFSDHPRQGGWRMSMDLGCVCFCQYEVAIEEKETRHRDTWSFFLHFKMFIAIIPFCYCYVYTPNNKILVGVDNDGCIQLDFIWSHFFFYKTLNCETKTKASHKQTFLSQ